MIFHDALWGGSTVECVGDDLFPLLTCRGESVVECDGVVRGCGERESHEG